MQYRSVYPQYGQSILLDTSKRSARNSNGVKFPEFVQKIITSDSTQYGNLYVGNFQAAQNRQLLKNLKIDGILSVAQDYPVKHPKQVIRYFKYIPIPDNKDAEIYKYLQECVGFIADTLLLTNILVHCVSGENRSACAVIAYLIHSKKISFDEAYHQVKSSMKMVQLGDNIKNQLKKYQLDLNNTGLRKSKYNPSVRVNTQIKNSSLNVSQSYFNDKVLMSQESVLSNKNNPNPELAREMSKSRQSYRSKTCQDTKQPNIVINGPKAHTKQQNAENSLSSNKQWKSMKVYLKPSSLDKSNKEKSLSRVSSIKYQSQYELDQQKGKSNLEKFNLVDNPNRGNHQEFLKRLNLLDSRNEAINAKYRETQTNFDRINQQNKLILESQLNEINSMRQQLHKHYNQRKSKINQRAKTYFSKAFRDMQDQIIEDSISNSNERFSEAK